MGMLCGVCGLVWGVGCGVWGVGCAGRQAVMDAAALAGEAPS